MNTPSHWLMTVVIGKHWQADETREKIPKLALGLGSIAPDLALYFLSFGGIAYYGQVLGWPAQDVGQYLFKFLYYHDPWWIGLHNFLHSPTMLLLLMATCLGLSKRWGWRPWLRWLAYFLAACMLHSAVDIVTHNDDGPVLFFPFEWHTRFSSPVSYWDSDHFGRPFAVFEIALNLFLIAYLVRHYFRQKRNKTG